MKKSLGEIMHGFSEEITVPKELVFENMPSFPRISKSNHITLMLVNKVKRYIIKDQECILWAQASYIDEQYTYRYLDYRQVFVDKSNVGTIIIRIRFINDKTVRITMNEGFDVLENETEMIKELQMEKCQVIVEEGEDSIQLSNGELTVIIEKEPWNLSIINKKGNVIYKQFGRDNHSFMPYEVCPFGFLFDHSTGEQYACEAVNSDAYEEFYGLGENFTSVNRKGRAFDLWNTNSLGVNTERGYKYIPFYISTNGYGVFYNTSRKIRCDMSAAISKANSTMIEGEVLDMFLIEGRNMKDIIPYYYRLTGFPAVPPKWSFGIWMSKISYGTREEVERVSKKMRENDLPCDVIHIDTDWFAENWVCDWKFDKKKFPEVERMIEHLHQQGYKISLWQLPYIERGKISYEVYDEGIKNGYFAANSNGDMQFPHGLIDFTNPEAVVWYKNKLIKPLLKMGIDVIKVDFGESAPSFFKYAGKNGKEMHNLYALLYNRAVYEATKEELGEEHALIWARSAWAGSQKYPVHWGGDAGTDFGSLASSVKGCLNVSISGIPFWSSDIGGFWFDSNPILYIRWLQFGMFCSHARFHGFYSREPWDFGETAVEVYRIYAKLRYQLLPYIYNQAIAVKEEHTLIHRPMIYEYPDDRNVIHLDTQYLFGRELLVMPVLNEKNFVRGYLPKGIWTDFHTDERILGETWIEKTVPIERMPVYVRENAIIPMCKAMNYVGESNERTYMIHFYPGQGEGHMACYEEKFEVFMLAAETMITISYTETDYNLTLILHNIEANEIYSNGNKLKYQQDGTTTIIPMGSLLERQEINITIK